jgi:uncharacterized YkwD family protein
MEQGLVTGFADGTFRPDETVTEEQFLAMWLRAFGYRDDRSNRSRWSDPYYRAAQSIGLPVTGKREAAINRQSVAEMIAASDGQSLRGADAIQYLLDQGWSRGKTAPTVEGYRGQDLLTRAEAVQFIRNVMGSRGGAGAVQEPEPGTEAEPADEPDQLSEDERLMFRLVNEERVKAGLKPLELDMELTRVARLKSRDMVDNKYFDHTSPTYGSPFEMIEQFGITFRAAGENLAGNNSVEDAHVSLMNSRGHRANILNESFTHIGIGIVEGSIYGKIYTQMFIQK